MSILFHCTCKIFFKYNERVKESYSSRNKAEKKRAETDTENGYRNGYRKWIQKMNTEKNLRNTMKIENNVFLVTGGASGLGLALVQGIVAKKGKCIVSIF